LREPIFEDLIVAILSLIAKNEKKKKKKKGNNK